MTTNSIGVTFVIFGVCGIVNAATFHSDYVNVETVGSGPDVILIPGLASSPDVWSGVAGELKKGYRLHLVSVSGFAGSTAAENAPESYIAKLRDEVSRYIEAEKLKEPLLIGHSMGGLTALLVAGNERAKVQKVIIVDTLPFFSLLFNPSVTSEQITPQAMALEKQLESMDAATFEQMAASTASILTKNAEKRDQLEKWIKASDRKVYAQCTREVMSYDARPKLKLISCPVTVIHAYDKDMPIPREQLEMLYKRSYEGLKDVRIVEVPDSYHFIMWDNPKGFIKTLSEVLSDVTSSQVSEADKAP